MRNFEGRERTSVDNYDGIRSSVQQSADFLDDVGLETGVIWGKGGRERDFKVEGGGGLECYICGDADIAF